MSKLKAGRTYAHQYEGEVFQLRVLSGEADDRIQSICSEYAASNDKHALLLEAIGLCVSSWPWEGSLRSVLNDRDCWELIGAARKGAVLTADERKKLELQPPSETG